MSHAMNFAGRRGGVESGDLGSVEEEGRCDCIRSSASLDMTPPMMAMPIVPRRGVVRAAGPSDSEGGGMVAAVVFGEGLVARKRALVLVLVLVLVVGPVSQWHGRCLSEIQVQARSRIARPCSARFASARGRAGALRRYGAAYGPVPHRIYGVPHPHTTPPPPPKHLHTHPPTTANPTMADPFEVRMRFTSQLTHLNASQTSALKAASYALKNREQDEDLHSCILEQLELNNTNTRANILYFLEALCDLSQKEGYMAYVRMLQRDILRIIDVVVPGDGSGAANVKVVRRVIRGLEGRGVLEKETVRELEEGLKERGGGNDVSMGGLGIGGGAGMMAGGGPQPVDDPLFGGAGGVAIRNGAPAGAGRGAGRMRFSLGDKGQIEQRIEEDRERHKRLRENIWAVSGEDDVEVERMWEESSEIGEDDWGVGVEDRDERRMAAGVV
ncbi:CTD kinase subunit gamma CTK3-domain-containing protein [Clohesyomyces aquaticus]|uniref:CTD kinase subunit gamma CTK3-domain-containing protein n=1 Tax=Clohesyomyces aquaticus TaxID=1231657 RepID=A0A1Y1Y206_9PLEO|nr:CTD kinase subunit gamma CTK3-domain-containing protein [Clohesyomyces aquaticus]